MCAQRIPDEMVRVKVRCPNCGKEFYGKPIPDEASESPVDSEGSIYDARELEKIASDDLGLHDLAKVIIDFSSRETREALLCYVMFSARARISNEKRQSVFVDLVAFYEFMVLARIAHSIELSNDQLATFQHELEGHIWLAAKTDKERRQVIESSLTGMTSACITELVGRYFNDDKELTALSERVVKSIAKSFMFDIDNIVQKSYIYSFIRIFRLFEGGNEQSFYNVFGLRLWPLHANCANAAAKFLEDFPLTRMPRQN